MSVVQRGPDEVELEARVVDTTRRPWLAAGRAPPMVPFVLVGGAVFVGLAWVTGSPLPLVALAAGGALLLVSRTPSAQSGPAEFVLGAAAQLTGFAARELVRAFLWTNLSISVQGRRVRWNGREAENLQLTTDDGLVLRVVSGARVAEYLLQHPLTAAETALLRSALAAAAEEPGGPEDVPPDLLGIRRSAKVEPEQR